MELIQKLIKIQKELKAPKSNFNSFGNYKYRSCEDILEAVKPLLEDATVYLMDEIVAVNGRIYLKATATFTDGKTSINTTAFAREQETKKGMDEAQVTGATSSYARKYALNALFLIDDTKDADTDEFTKQTSEQPKKIEKPTTSNVKTQICPICWQEHGGQYPKCINCYKKEKELKEVNQEPF